MEKYRITWRYTVLLILVIFALLAKAIGVVSPPTDGLELVEATVVLFILVGLIIRNQTIYNVTRLLLIITTIYFLVQFLYYGVYLGSRRLYFIGSVSLVFLSFLIYLLNHAEVKNLFQKNTFEPVAGGDATR